MHKSKDLLISFSKSFLFVGDVMHKYINEEKNRSETTKGAFSLLLSVIFVKLIGFIYKVPLSHILGDEGMGYFNSAYTIFAFFYMLCSGGVPRAVSILITEYSVKGREKDIEYLLRASVLFFGGIGAFFALLFLLFPGTISSMIGNGDAANSLMVIAPSLIFVSISGVFRGYLSGKGSFVSIAISEVLDAALKFIVGLLFAIIAKTHSLSAATISAYTIFGVTIGSFVSSIFLFISVNIQKARHKPRQNDRATVSLKDVLSAVIRISLPITTSSAVMGISNIIDLGSIMKRLINGGMSIENAVAVYGNFTTLAVPMFNLATALISPLSTSALPAFAALSIKNERARLGEELSKCLCNASLLCSPLAFAYLLFPKEILMLLFNDASARYAAPLLSILSYGVLIVPALTVINTFLEATGHQKLTLLSMSICAAIKLSVGVILLERYGIYGAPLGTVISYLCALVISLTLAIIKERISLAVFHSYFLFAFFAFSAVLISRSIYLHFGKGIYSPSLFLSSVFVAAIIYFILLVLFYSRNIKMRSFFVKITKKSEAHL